MASSNWLECYNPLYDVHLRQYFAMPHMQKHLRSLGLIDSNGAPTDQQREMYVRHHMMMDMMLKNREQQLQKLIDLQRKLNAAEKVEICRRVRSGVTSPEGVRRGPLTRSLSRGKKRSASSGPKDHRRHSHSEEDVLEKVEEAKKAEPETINQLNTYARLSAAVSKYRYLHKLDDHTLSNYAEQLRKDIERIEKFRAVSFGPFSVARQQPEAHASWFFRRRSLPSLADSANAPPTDHGARISPRKLDASHDSRATFPPVRRRRSVEGHARLPPIGTKGKPTSAAISSGPNLPKLPPTNRPLTEKKRVVLTKSRDEQRIRPLKVNGNSPIVKEENKQQQPKKVVRKTPTLPAIGAATAIGTGVGAVAAAVMITEAIKSNDDEQPPHTMNGYEHTNGDDHEPETDGELDHGHQDEQENGDNLIEAHYEALEKVNGDDRESNTEMANLDDEDVHREEEVQSEKGSTGDIEVEKEETQNEIEADHENVTEETEDEQVEENIRAVHAVDLNAPETLADETEAVIGNRQSVAEFIEDEHEAEENQEANQAEEDAGFDRENVANTPDNRDEVENEVGEMEARELVEEVADHQDDQVEYRPDTEAEASEEPPTDEVNNVNSDFEEPENQETELAKLQTGVEEPEAEHGDAEIEAGMEEPNQRESPIESARSIGDKWEDEQVMTTINNEGRDESGDGHGEENVQEEIDTEDAAAHVEELEHELPRIQVAREELDDELEEAMANRKETPIENEREEADEEEGNGAAAQVEGGEEEVARAESVRQDEDIIDNDGGAMLEEREEAWSGEPLSPLHPEHHAMEDQPATPTSSPLAAAAVVADDRDSIVDDDGESLADTGSSRRSSILRQ